MTSICSTVEHTIWFCDWPISWADTGDFLSGVGTLIGAVAVIYGATQGFKQWRRQKLAERNMESADHILAAAFGARRAIESVRHSWMDGREHIAAREQLKDAPRYIAADQDKKHRLETAQAYINRLRESAKFQEALDECQTTTLAMLDEELTNAIKFFVRQFWFVQVYVEAYADITDPHEKFSRQIQAAMFQKQRDSDEEISVNVAQSMKTIEERCKPHLTEEVRQAYAKLTIDVAAKVVEAGIGRVI